MKTTYQKDDRLPQHTAVGNDDTPITYPTSPAEWMSVKAVEEKDGRIAELEAVNERLETENHHLQTAAADVMAENVRLEAENAENLKLLYGRDLEIERLTAALGKCSQARAELGNIVETLCIELKKDNTLPARRKVARKYLETLRRMKE